MSNRKKTLFGGFVGKTAGRQGNKYYGVRLETGEGLFFHADHVSVENGYFSAWTENKDSSWRLTLSGKYMILWQCENISGCAVSVEYWDDLHASRE